MKIKNILTGIVLVGSMFSCSGWLDEKPLDFLTPENSFKDQAGIEAAVYNIYSQIRNNFFFSGDNEDKFLIYGVDTDINCRKMANKNYIETYHWATLNSQNGMVKRWWQIFYSQIFNANVVLDRSEAADVKWKSEEDKNALIGEAKFLRAFAYHFLANMWGDVPLVLHETTAPKFDYKNAPQMDVYKQCKEDLEFAIQYLPDVDHQTGGRAPKEAALHLLTEVLIQMGDFQGAVDAATKVINNPSMSLMTERFGRYKNFKFEGYDHQGDKEPWGDVYWDLFRDGNFNRIDGNKECIWNTQFEYGMVGGGWGNILQGPDFERWYGTPLWNIPDVTGQRRWLMSTLDARQIKALCPTPYASFQIWENCGEDMRGNEYNLERDYYWTNPKNKWYGQKMEEEHIGDKSLSFSIKYPRFMKLLVVEHHGTANDPNSGAIQDGGPAWKDWYLMRLAETYLLRAEAYVKMNQLDKAAADINAVRMRSNATPVKASEVDIEYILDERVRELYAEEFRINTLLRTGKLVEHLNKYNPKLVQMGVKVPDYFNRFPIPYSEIEANKEGGLVQNPGYVDDDK